MMKENNLLVYQSKTSKTYKNKKLNNANFHDFTHTDYQVFLHLISKIGGVDEFGKYLQPEQLQREHILTAREFSELFNVSLSNCYGILKKAVDKLMKKSIRIEKPDDRGFWIINVCSKAEYNKHEGSIIIKFTDDIMPYLAQVKQRFVLYNLKEIANFGSLYTTRLYELIQEFQETGWMLKSVDQLREVFAVNNKFTAYKDFKKYTFGHACQEINDNYDMDLRFEEEKERRKVVAVKFFFKPTIVNQVTNQKTGISTNIYTKPKPQPKIKSQLKEKAELELPEYSDVLEGQLSFEDWVKDLPESPAVLKDQKLSSKNSTATPKPMKNIFSSILSKLTPSRK